MLHRNSICDSFNKENITNEQHPFFLLPIYIVRNTIFHYNTDNSCTFLNHARQHLPPV
jgi:hypothetical protein